MTGALGGVLLGARQDRFVYEAVDNGWETLTTNVHTWSLTEGDNLKSGEDLNYLAFVMGGFSTSAQSMTGFTFDGVTANYYNDWVADNTNSEHAAIGIGVHYIDDGDTAKTAVSTWNQNFGSRITGYYRFLGGRGNVTIPTYIERADVLYPQTHSGISVKKDDVVIVLVNARNLAANPISATNLTQDFAYGSGETDRAGFSTQITEDGTFETTIDVINEEQQYGHMLIVVRKGE